MFRLAWPAALGEVRGCETMALGLSDCNLNGALHLPLPRNCEGQDQDLIAEGGYRISLLPSSVKCPFEVVPWGLPDSVRHRS